MDTLPRRMKRLLPLLLVTATALVGAGCGAEHGPAGRTAAETEGLYLDLAGAKYQIQMSRQLNPADREDRDYLVGLPANTPEPAGDETWFGIFLRVENVSEQPVTPAGEFEIVDTEEQIYRPVTLDREANPFAYAPEPIAPKELLPHRDSAAGNGPTNGSLVLFKLPMDAFANRPLIFKIHGESGEVEVDIDL
jgi:hypothetical protein